MNRLNTRLAALKEKQRKALVTYIVNGDPAPEYALPAMRALVDAGADIIELGIPFSDPMAEGPVIQKAHERALVHGTSLTGTMAVVKQFRETDRETPVVLMGYANPIERMGYENFASQAMNAGVDGVIIVDLPPEEAVSLNEQLKLADIENIFLLAPTTTEARIKQVTAIAGGFIYYVSLKGVTGAGNLDVKSVETKLTEIGRFTDLPLMVGFGIKDAQSAKAVGGLADGVVVGSVLVDAMGGAETSSIEQVCEKLTKIVGPIREGLDSLSTIK